MDVMFFLLSIGAVIIMIIGVINPKKAIIPYAKANRAKAGITWLCFAIVFFIISIIINMIQTPNYSQLEVENEIIVVTPTAEIVSKATLEPTATPIDIYGMTDEEYTKYILDKSSKKLFLIDEAIYEKSYYDEINKEYIIEAYTGGWMFDDDYWTLIEPHSKNIFDYIYNDNKLKYNRYKLIFNRDFTDEYGNVYISKGAEMQMSIETLDKINWDSLKKVIFTDIADNFTEYYK